MNKVRTAIASLALGALMVVGVSPAAAAGQQKTALETVGITKHNSLSDVALLEHAVRDDLNKTSARFMAVLKTQQRPAILIEGGYLSDRNEAKLLASPDYRQKLAFAVAKALE